MADRSGIYKHYKAVLSNLSAMAGRIDFILGVVGQYAVAVLAL